MDGLTIANGNALVERGQTMREMRSANVNVPKPNIENPAGPAGASGSKSFADTLKEAVQNVNEAQKTADTKAQELATGKSQDVADVMISAEKADIALKLMVSVRNKIIEAYQEVMKMQV